MVSRETLATFFTKTSCDSELVRHDAGPTRSLLRPTLRQSVCCTMVSLHAQGQVTRGAGSAEEGIRPNNEKAGGLGVNKVHGVGFAARESGREKQVSR